MKILLLGKHGQVGWELQRALSPLGDVYALGRMEADLENLNGLRSCVRKYQPDVIVNAAAYTAVDKAESETDKARRINAEAVDVLAEEATRSNAWLVHYSTDYVFDGKKDSPYSEFDPANPLSVYGRTKFDGEQRIRERQAKHLIFRTSWVYSTRGSNFAKTILKLAKERDALKVVADQFGAPTSADLIADVTALAIYRVTSASEPSPALAGTYHLTADGHASWHCYARYVLELAQARGVTLKARPETVDPITTEQYPLPAARPCNSRLDTTKLAEIFNIRPPDWRLHMQRLIDELASQGRL